MNNKMKAGQNDLVFERTITPVIGTIKPDADGYYDINAGAYGVFNASGVYYAQDNIEKLFENTGLLQSRFDKGIVYSELGHPQKGSMSEAEYEQRMRIMDEKNWCGHIRKAKLLDSVDGKYKITNISVRPHGPHAKTLEDSLTNKFDNCYFSVRSCSNRVRVNGMTVKYVYEIINWDKVTQGGIPISNKADSNPVTDLEHMTGDSIYDLIKTQEMSSINLNDTTEVRYILNNMNEYKGSIDAESALMMDTYLDVLTKAVRQENVEAIFNW